MAGTEAGDEACAASPRSYIPSLRVRGGRGRERERTRPRSFNYVHDRQAVLVRLDLLEQQTPDPEQSTHSLAGQAPYLRTSCFTMALLDQAHTSPTPISAELVSRVIFNIAVEHIGRILCC